MLRQKNHHRLRQSQRICFARDRQNIIRGADR